VLVVIFAEKVALQEAARRAFPHIYEENDHPGGRRVFAAPYCWDRVLLTFAQL